MWAGIRLFSKLDDLKTDLEYSRSRSMFAQPFNHVLYGLYLARTSGERLQDHWSAAFVICLEDIMYVFKMWGA